MIWVAAVVPVRKQIMSEYAKAQPRTRIPGAAHAHCKRLAALMAALTAAKVMGVCWTVHIITEP